MAIITISRGSFSRGKEVAEKVAAHLSYECISREVLLDASDRFRIPEIKLVGAIHDAPSILDRLTHGKESYVAYIQSALTRRVAKDNVVYHGLAGHLLLKSVPHLLKVRIIAELADRIAEEMKREGVSEEVARTTLFRDDQERRKWTKSLYGVDPWDPALYDLVIRIHRLTTDDAVDCICQAVNKEQFKTTKEAQRMMDDLALASQIKAALVEKHFDVAVLSEYGNVLVYNKGSERLLNKLEEQVKELSSGMKGINNIEVHTGVPGPPDAI